ncbi:MAG: MarR family transcriptional regulator [Candidatus Aenigmarchaeota archaeon]|nr:MarR family transcriptional regulator [Candidatus Aenigmarchaeota archaeon]
METRIINRIKNIGMLIAGISAVGFLVLLILSLQIAESQHLACPGLTAGCTALGHFPLLAFIGLAALAALIFSGGWIYVKAGRELAYSMQTRTGLLEAAKRLRGEEKALYDFVVQNEGTAFQNDIVKSLSYSKVKVSRILDRLETKGLIERRRRGMANLVILKSS